MAKKNPQVQAAIAEAMNDNSVSRYKNPWFYVGIGGMLLVAMGIEPETLTSWKLVGDAIVQFVSNPVAIFGAAAAILGVFTNPTTKGIRD
jgi:phi LC3 family holin